MKIMTELEPDFIYIPYFLHRTKTKDA